jgi:hypothetical protein
VKVEALRNARPSQIEIFALCMTGCGGYGAGVPG